MTSWCHLALNFVFVCVEAAKVPMSATDKMKIWYVKIMGGLQVADTEKMFTHNWPCSQMWKHKENPALFSSASLLFS